MYMKSADLQNKVHLSNINGRDVQRTKCCKQCGQVKFIDTMTKWPVQKHTVHNKSRSIQRRNRH